MPGRDADGRGRAVLRRRRGKRRNPIERVLRAPVSDVIEIIIKRERATMSSLLQLPFAIPLSLSFLFSFSLFFFLNRVRGIMAERNYGKLTE